MRKVTDKRHNGGTAKHRVLAVFIALWVSLGLQPCAVADIDDVDCPHCPAEQMQPMAAGSDHCNPASESSFSSAPSDCYEAEASAVDGRLAKIDSKDADQFSPAIPAREPFDSIRFNVTSSNAVGPPGQGVRAGAIPLYILYCVYRD